MVKVKRWIHLADSWTTDEKREMLEYLKKLLEDRKFMCPSCGEVIIGVENLKEHWKREAYEIEHEYSNFDIYKSMAEYEYETHIGWRKKKIELRNPNLHTFK